ncbi:MAG: ATP-grasp domain-containing protein [Candidatus Levybacteria bacterium]|nr:ATP-grasp domain-containing protein [Candidatus Levybacteria bacterium]
MSVSDKITNCASNNNKNYLVNSKINIAKEFEKLKDKSLYVERFVKFNNKLAIIVARNIKGEIVTYPIIETIYKNNISHTIFAPAKIEKKVA